VASRAAAASPSKVNPSFRVPGGKAGPNDGKIENLPSYRRAANGKFFSLEAETLFMLPRIYTQEASGVPSQPKIGRLDMKRIAIAVVALATLAGPIDAPVLAQTKMDCSRLYKDFWEKFDREKFAKISAEQLSGVSRMALRAYDACQAGDEQDAKALFDRLSRMTF
jgi:hypothetical protein